MMIPKRIVQSSRRATLLISALLLGNPATPVFAQVPPDGFWTVSGRAISGTRCADWTIRLAVEQRRLTGVVSVGQGNVIIQNAVLRPDGSFSGNTLEGHVNNRHVRAYTVTGRFSGELVNLAISSVICPDRRGSALRRPTGY
jgi:hypothetical protein